MERKTGRTLAENSQEISEFYALKEFLGKAIRITAEKTSGVQRDEFGPERLHWILKIGEDLAGSTIAPTSENLSKMKQIEENLKDAHPEIDRGNIEQKYQEWQNSQNAFENGIRNFLKLFLDESRVDKVIDFFFKGDKRVITESVDSYDNPQDGPVQRIGNYIVQDGDNTRKIPFVEGDLSSRFGAKSSEQPQSGQPQQQQEQVQNPPTQKGPGSSS